MNFPSKIKLSITPLSQWFPSTDKPLTIFGPCSAESEKQLIDTAKSISKNFPNNIFRAGIWKPRTRPNSFEGVGSVGLQWLKKVKQETGMLVATEVANAHHIDECLKAGIDVLWLGARTTGNPFSVQEIADALVGVDIPVFVKNPLNPDLQLWLGALERINDAGITKIGAIHRGFHSTEKTNFRYSPKWELVIALKTIIPELPIVCDPSHICGNTEMLENISQKALDLAMDGLMLETHISPKQALSDAHQQITPEKLFEIFSNLTIRKTFSENVIFKSQLEMLRDLIDRADEELLQVVSKRMSIVQKIGEYKKENNVTILQIKRWEEILRNQLQTGNNLALSSDFIKHLYLLIHDESIRLQTGVMNEKKQEV